MRYGEIVQDLAARGHDWHYYDGNFLGSHPSGIVDAITAAC